MKKGRIAKWLPRDEPINSEPLGKVDYACGFLVLFVSFGVYLHTLTPTVGFHDSGELITVAYTLGIAHPPGYPLYTLLGKVFCTLIPIGNIAYRMNMQSSLFASLAVMLTYFIILKLIPNPQSLLPKIVSAIVGSLILAFSATFWEQAIIAEKYTLNAFFFTLLIFILLKWQESKSKIQNLKSKIYLCLFSFLLGLSFCHHFQTIYLVPGSIFFIVAVSLKNRKRVKAKTQTKSSSLFTIHSTLYTLLFFILPLTLWAYLPLRASQEPVMNWGDPSNWENFIIHITGQDYGGYFSPIKESFHRLIPHLNFFYHQFSLWMLGVGLLAIPIFLWKKRIIFLFFALISATNTIHSIRYTIDNIQDYYIPSFILVAVLIGFGLSFITRLMPKHLKPIFILFLLLSLIPCSSNYFRNNRGKFYFAYDYGMNMVKPLKKNSIVFSQGDDNIFPVQYLQYIEKQRDITIINLTLLADDWYAKRIKKEYPYLSFPYSLHKLKKATSDKIENIIQARVESIIFNNRNSSLYLINERPLPKDYSIIPEGFFYRIIEKNWKFKELHQVELKYRDGINIFKDQRTSTIISSYAVAYVRYGDFYLTLKNYDKAIIEYKKALKILPNDAYIRHNLGIAHYNLGIIYHESNEYCRAIKEYEKAIEINPQDIDVYYNLGIAYYLKGNYKKAAFAFTKVLEIDPNNEKAKKNLISLSGK